MLHYKLSAHRPACRAWERLQIGKKKKKKLVMELSARVLPLLFAAA